MVRTVESVCANSSQAKGRVERANLTLQDRLLKEVRLRNISTMAAGNEYAPAFIEDFNQRFAKPPHNDFDVHRLVRDDEVFIASNYQSHAGVFGRIDIERDGLLAPGAVGRPFYKAIREVGLAYFKNAQGTYHLVCLLDLELFSPNDAVQGLGYLRSSQIKACAQHPHQLHYRNYCYVPTPDTFQ